MLPLVASGPADVRAALEALGLRPPAPLPPAQPSADSLPPARPGATLPPLPPQDPTGADRPEHRLAVCLGLSGCVSLADHLERADHSPLPRADEAASAIHVLVSAKLAKRRAALHERLKGRTRRTFEGRRCPPDAAAVHALLQREEALISRQPEQVVACARQLQGPYRDHFADNLGIVRKEMRFLREDVHVALGRVGPRVAELLELDALMQPSLAVRVQDSHAALVGAVERRFAERFMAALVEVPTESAIELAQLAPWFAARGWVWSFLFDCQRLCLAVLDAECAAIQGLVDAACGPQAPDSQRVRSSWAPPESPRGSETQC